MNKAVFLDRDGVINFERGDYTCKIDDFIINDGVGEAIKLLKNNDFLVIIISNQAGLAKKLFSEEDLLEMHIKFCIYLDNYKTKIDDFFYCPHHPNFTNCLCRKPNSLLFEKAMAIYNIEPKISYMIGDRERDIISAEKCGIKTILIESNKNIFNICKNIVENKL